MKKIIKYFLILFLVFASQSIFAQQIGNLEGINYQAVAIDETGREIVGTDISGKPLYEKTIGIRFSILKGSNGIVEYQETQSAITDKYGLFSVVIGKGEQTGDGAYSSLLEMPWIDADQFLKVEIAIKNDGNYREVSNQKFMSVPYSFYTDDIADNAITTAKILDETILAKDIGTGSVETSEILDETIQAEDIDTSAVTTSEILNETIQAEDIDTSAVTTSEILNETIQAEDIDTSAVTTSEILDATILNEDIADSTIDLPTKVTGILPAVNGGVGIDASTAANGTILIGNGAGFALDTLTAGTGIAITNTAGGIIIKSTISGGVNSNANTSANPGNINAGSTWVSSAFVLTQPANLAPIAMGDLLIGSADVDMQGCMMNVYLTDANGSVAHARVAIFNGTGANVNLGNGVNIKILVVK